MRKDLKLYAKDLFTLLKHHYPDAHMILEWSNNFELLVAIILSAQCTDLTVNRVTKLVFPKYNEPREKFQKLYEVYKNRIKLPEKDLVKIVNFASVPITELEQDIKSTGFYHNKAKNIQAAAKIVLDTFHGVIPDTIHEMETIPGVGRKTANVFLGNAYHISEGIAVDTHVKKQAKLLGLTNQTDPHKIEQDLMQLFPQKDWFPLTYLLIEHGRNMRRKKSERILCDDKKCTLCT